MISIWTYQFSSNSYDQEGYYTTHYWVKKPSLFQFVNDIYGGKKIEDLAESTLLKAVRIFNGEEINGNRLVECKNGKIDYEFS